MPINTTLVNEISSDIRVLKDTTEFLAYVGCSPTAISTIVGYWDRNGFDNLIEGDSSFFSDDVKRAIASPEHFRDYRNPEEERDASETIPDVSELSIFDAHENNSIADFAFTSRSVLGSIAGSTKTYNAGIGLHGYAAYRGYDDFQATYKKWGEFTFEDIVAEIDAGRPVQLSVDSNADGKGDHATVVFGYNKATQQIAFHNGWQRRDREQEDPDFYNLTWSDFKDMADGRQWGIRGATFVRPPESTIPSTQTQFMELLDDGSGTAASSRSTLTNSGIFQSKLQADDSSLGRTKSIAIASQDGHTSYRLYDDGDGSAALYAIYAYGDGKFRYRLLNAESNLGMDTLGLATADGKTFYQLYDDGEGSAAIYRATLESDGSFTTTLLNKDSRLSRSKSLSLSTTDGKTFYRLYDDGEGTAASYELELRSDGKFDYTLLNSESGISRKVIDQVAWNPREIPLNQAPNANEDSATTSVDVPVVIDVLANDTEPDGDDLRIAAVQSPANGTAEIVNGKIRYTPNANVTATDRFTYTITDGRGGTDTAEVTVTVEAPASNPSGLLKNGDFESGLNKWKVFSGDATPTTDAFAGNGAIALSVANSGIDQGFNVTPGTTYNLSGYGQTTSTGWSALSIAFYDAGWNQIERQNSRINTSTWSQYDINATAPDRAANAIVSVWKGGTDGTTLVDDISVSASGTTPPPPSTQLLNNADFEADLTGWKTFSGAETITTDAFSGSQALQVSGQGSGVSQAAAVTPGITYQLSGAGKTSSAGWVGFGVDYWDANWNKLDGSSTQIIGDNWSTYQVASTAPAGATRMTTWLWNEGETGATYLDDVVLQPLS